MKTLIYVSFLILIGAFLIYLIPVLASPSGNDIQNAIDICNKVELIMKNNGYKVGDGSNIVMMRPKKNKLVVVIKNAQPNIDAIHSIINQNKHFLGTKSLTIIFKDRLMNQVEIRKVNQ